MKIAILGFGIVGQGVYRILSEQKKAHNPLLETLSVKKILVRDPAKKRKTPVPQELFSNDFSEILRDPEIELIVEVTSDKNKAVNYMAESLRAGKHVVTANKAALADHFKMLQDTAKTCERHLKFEASVAGGIPVLAPLGRISSFDNIYLLRGIVNSSTNYVLTEICKGRALNEVKREARELGVLEENPEDDLCGHDAIRKLSIMSMMILRQEIKEADIPGFGITQVDDRDSEILGKDGYQIKLLAELLNGEKAGLKRDEICFSVFPTALRNNRFNHVDGLFNEVAWRGEYCSELRFSGFGGTMFPTASAVVSDIIGVLTSEPQYFPQDQKHYHSISENRTSVFYLRLHGSGRQDRNLERELRTLADQILTESDSELTLLTKPIAYRDAQIFFAKGVHVVRIFDEKE